MNDKSGTTETKDFWDRLKIFGSLFTGLAAVCGLILLWLEISNQTKQTELMHTDQITDRINAAVMNLGAVRTWVVDGRQETEPNIEVRIGGLYALERISQDSARDHVQMMEILTAYVRQNAKAKDAFKDIPEQEEGEDAGEYGDRLRDLIPKPCADIQIAITVLARRGRIEQEQEQGYTLDLSNTNLQGIFFAVGSNLNNVRFNNAELAGANFNGAQLQGAEFRDAKLQAADFWNAELAGAYFREAQLQGADFWNAKLQGAEFTGAQLQKADFRDAELQEANFWLAQLQGAHFRKNSLRETKNLEQDQLQRSFGDGTVKLPDGLTRPNHWPQETLVFGDYFEKYQQWLQATYPNLYKQFYGQ